MSDTATDLPPGKALSAGRVEELFTTPEGTYRFCRWGRPIAPVVFGVDDETLGHLKDAMAMVLEIAEMEFVDTDPELGANLMIFFCSEWDELDMVPNLDQLLPDFDILKNSLKRTGASQYRSFAFDENGAIKVCIVLLRFDEHMAETSVQTMGVAQMTQAILVWGDEAFEDESPIALIPETGMCIVKPGYAAVIRAAYDPALPPSSMDSSHAMRLAARAKLLLKDDGEGEAEETAGDDASV